MTCVQVIVSLGGMPMNQVSQKYPPVLLEGTVNELDPTSNASPSLRGTLVNGSTLVPLVRLVLRTAQKLRGLSNCSAVTAHTTQQLHSICQIIIKIIILNKYLIQLTLTSYHVTTLHTEQNTYK